MKRIYIVYIVCFMFMFSLVSAEEWNSSHSLLYDNHDDSSVDTSLWEIVFPPVSEGSGVLLVGGSNLNNDASSIMFNDTNGLDMKAFGKNTTLILELQRQVGSGPDPTQEVRIANDNAGSTITLWSGTSATTISKIEFDYDGERARVIKSGTPEAWQSISSLAQWRLYLKHTNSGAVGCNPNCWGMTNNYINYTIAGEVNYSGPGDYAIQGQNLAFSINGTAPNNNSLVNSSLYIDGALNESINLSGKTNTSSYNKSFSLGSYVWELRIADEQGDVFSTGNQSLTVNSAVENSQTFNANVLTESVQNFTLNASVFGSITSSKFIYNGTSYSASFTDYGAYYLLTMENFNVPAVTISTPLNFSWNITTNDSITTSIDERTQTINVIDIDNCTSYTNVVYNFTIVDEKTQNKLSGTTASADVEFYASGTNNLVGNLSTNYATNSFAICISSALNDNLDVDAQIQYGATDYVNEFYNLQDDLVSDSNQHQNITLYSLDNSSSTTFKVLYKDSSFIAVENALIQVGRKYISEGVFKTVEQPTTDSNGETLVHLELEDVIYTFTVIVDGQVDSIFNNVIASCPNPSLEPCEISLNAINSFVDLTDFSKTTGLTFSFDFDKDTRQVTAIYSILSGSSDLVSLNVSLFDNLGNNTICVDSVTSSSGTLACTVPTSFGNTTIVADLYHEGTHVGQSIISMNQDPSELYGANIVFLGIIIVLSLAGISLMGNPIISGFFLIVTAIVLMALNIITSTGWIGAGATILWFIVAVVIVIIKGVNR